MKKLSLAIVLSVAALMMTGCRKSNVQPIGGGNGVGPFGDYEMTLSASNGDEKSSIEGLKINYQLGDKLHVVDADNGYLGYLTATSVSGTSGTFKGFITKPGVNHECLFYFVGTNKFSLDGDNYTFDVHEQYGGLSVYVGNVVNDDYENGGTWKGGIDDVSNGLQLMKSKESVEVTQTMLDAHNFGSQAVQMRSMMAISRLNLQVNGTSMGGELTDSVTVNGAGCYSTGTLNIKTGILTPNAGNITLKKANGDYYMVLIPANQTESTSQALTFTATSRNNESVSITPEVAANTFYNEETAKAVNMEPVETDEWINFGLPSPYENLKWSKKNIGATNGSTAQSWYGDYYAWGETAPYVTLTWTDYQTVATKTWCTHPSHNSSITFDNSVGYRWKNYLDGTQTEWSTDYEWSPTPYDGTTKVLKPAYDAAYQNATPANTWRMPTGGSSGEWQLLKDNTYFQWTTGYNGIDDLNGYIVYKVKDSAHKGYWTYYSGSTWNTKNASGTVQSGYANQQNPFGYTASDPHMFLPTAGGFNETFLYFAGECGYYWSSSLNSGDPSSAWRIYFFSGYVNPQHSSSRSGGIPVRPVQ